MLPIGYPHANAVLIQFEMEPTNDLAVSAGESR